MASKALNTFRRKMANPLYWRKAKEIFLQYNKEDLCDLDRTKHLIETLASKLNVPLSPEEQEQAAQWLVGQGINPQIPKDRMMVWKRAK